MHKSRSEGIRRMSLHCEWDRGNLSAASILTIKHSYNSIPFIARFRGDTAKVHLSMVEN